MNQFKQILIIVILTISNYNYSFANDSLAFVNHFSKLLINQKSKKLEKLIFTVNDYERYSKNIGQDANEKELKNWERDIHEIINSTYECISEIKKQSDYVGDFKFYDFQLTPDFETITNRKGDTLSIIKKYRLRIIFEKGVFFYPIDTKLIEAFNSFWLIDELKWGDRIIPPPKKIMDNKKNKFYVVFSYNYGQILLDSRINKVFLNNYENPNYYTTKLKLTKNDKNRINKMLVALDYKNLPQDPNCDYGGFEPSPSCDIFRICLNETEYYKKYCCSDDLTIATKFNELGNLLKEIIENKKAYKRKKAKARMFIAI